MASPGGERYAKRWSVVVPRVCLKPSALECRGAACSPEAIGAGMLPVPRSFLPLKTIRRSRAGQEQNHAVKGKDPSPSASSGSGFRLRTLPFDKLRVTPAKRLKAGL